MSSRFARSLLFAGAAGLCTLPYLLVLTPALGGRLAFTSLCVLLLPAYLLAISRSSERGIRIALLGLILAAALAVLVPAETAILGTAALMGLLRSAFLFELRRGRALLLEAVLLLAGLGLARLWFASPAPTLAFSVWTFFLVESLYFLVGGIEPASRGRSPEDPFDKARRQAMSLMEDPAS